MKVLFDFQNKTLMVQNLLNQSNWDTEHNNCVIKSIVHCNSLSFLSKMNIAFSLEYYILYYKIHEIQNTKKLILKLVWACEAMNDIYVYEEIFETQYADTKDI